VFQDSGLFCHFAEWAGEFRKQRWSWSLAVNFCSSHRQRAEVVWISTLESWSLGCPCWYMPSSVHKVRLLSNFDYQVMYIAVKL